MVIALAAAIVFFLALLHVTLGSINLLYLGLFLLAVHLWLSGYGYVTWAPWRRGTPPA